MQRCKYPIKTMNITQSYTGTYSHSKNYNGSPRDYPIDDNCGTTGRSYFYAPFDCSIKRIYGVGAKGTNTIWIQSPGACADAQLYGLCDDHGDPSQR